MRFIDLNLKSSPGHTSALLRKEMANEFWFNSVCSTDGVCAGIRVSSLCGSLPRQLQGEELFMLGPISVLGLCSAHLSRKSQRHRGLSAGRRQEALPHGYSWQGLPQHPGSRQRGARLENLSRLCPSADPKCQRTLPQRSSRRRTRSNRLCFGFHHHRSLPVIIPPGPSFESARQR